MKRLFFSKKHDRIQFSRQGFALVVTLVLLALMLAVALATALFLRTDTEVGIETKMQEEAKQNAMLGLRKALGELQTVAGKDAVATGRADILKAVNEDFEHPYWTGVWEVSESGGETSLGDPHWLVSRTGAEEPDPRQEITGKKIDILTTRNRRDVRGESVEKIPLNGTDGKQRGEFAYWVADEGVKANIVASEPQKLIDDGDNAQVANESEMVALGKRTKLVHQARWERFIKTDSIDSASDTIGNDLTNLRRTNESEADRLVTRENVTLLPDNLVGGLPSFHNLTTYSVGLLTKTVEGGLKEDLTQILDKNYSESKYTDTKSIFSDSSEFSGTSPTWGLLRSYYNLGTDLGTIGKLEPTVSVRAQTTTEHGVYPLIGMLQLNWSVKAVQAGESLEITIKPIVVLVNPYTVRLAPASYEVDFGYASGGEIIIEAYDKDGNKEELGPYTQADLFGNPVQFNVNATKTLLPGEAQIFGLKDNGAGSNGITLESGRDAEKRWSIPTGATLDTDVVSIKLILSEGIIQAALRKVSPNPDPAEPSTSVSLQQISGVKSPGKTVELNPLDDASGIPNRIALRTVDMDQVGLSGSGGLKWLSLFNIRALNNGIPPGFSDGNPLYTASEPADPNPQEYPVASAKYRTYWAQSNKVVYPDPGEDPNPQQINLVFAPLFDVPRSEIISIASLQHANLALESWYPTNAVGNSYASPFFASGQKDFSYAINEKLFNNYFFSGIKKDTVWPDREDLLNTRLVFFEDKPDPDTFKPEHIAAKIGLRGAFNINSTSEQAWYALLSGLHGVDFPIFPRENSNSNSFEATSLSRSKSSQYLKTEAPILRHDIALGLSKASSYRKLWLGGRALPVSDIKKFISSPSQNLGIRYRMYQRRKPYASIAEFINRDRNASSASREALLSGLQQVVDVNGDSPAKSQYFSNYDPPATMINTTSVLYPAALTGLPEAQQRSVGRPGWITQADILRPLAPLLAARSDTFTIRAYGSVLNPGNGKMQAQAWCEAVVQRFPEYINPADEAWDTPSEAENMKFGRRFRVVSFRWLTKDEI